MSPQVSSVVGRWAWPVGIAGCVVLAVVAFLVQHWWQASAVLAFLLVFAFNWATQARAKADAEPGRRGEMPRH